MYAVYVLKSLKGYKTYVGCTKDLRNRIKEHNSGEVKSTKSRSPFVLWYKEEFVDKYDVFNREKHFIKFLSPLKIKLSPSSIPNFY